MQNAVKAPARYRVLRGVFYIIMLVFVVLYLSLIHI